MGTTGSVFGMMEKFGEWMVVMITTQYALHATELHA